MLGRSSHPALLVCELLVVLFCLESVLQTIYVASLFSRQDLPLGSIHLAHELSLAGALVVTAILCVEMTEGPVVLVVEFGVLGVPVDAMAAVGYACFALGALRVVGPSSGMVPSVPPSEAEVGAGRPGPLLGTRLGVALESVLVLLATTHASLVVGEHWFVCLVLLAAAMLYRTVSLVRWAHDRLNGSLTCLSPLQTLSELSEGVLCVTRDGRVLFMNDCMRRCLATLGLTADLGDLSGAWEKIAAAAMAHDGGRVSDGGVRVGVTSDEVRYLMRHDMVALGSGSVCILALDITEEERLRQGAQAVNQSLEEARRRLVDSLANVEETARIEARLTMRARVHDVIGQRLSILHRCLEDGDVSDETVEHLQVLLDDITSDLRDPHEANPCRSLDTLVAAFGLAGVDVCVTGSLPAGRPVAAFFVNTLREACTNAVRHGQARRVWVHLDQTEELLRLRVTNDGVCPVDGKIDERGGLGGMRHAAAALGATVRVTARPRFVVSVEVPLDPRPVSR